MPIFEYYCPDNNTLYRFFARRLGMDRRVPRCPENPAFRMEKRVSGFAITRATDKAHGDEQAQGEDDADDPRMEYAMAQMEKEMAAMDEDNPDPRQIGRMMRRMSELSGESMDGRMEEMIRRLEKGEHPDKLEEEYGDLMDGPGEDGMGGPPGMDDEGEGGDEDGADAAAGDREGAGGRLLRGIRRRGRRAVTRIDPELYELDDYVRKASRR